MTERGWGNRQLKSVGKSAENKTQKWPKRKKKKRKNIQICLYIHMI